MVVCRMRQDRQNARLQEILKSIRGKHPGRPKPTIRVPIPELPTSRPLTAKEGWKSLCWIVDVATSEGSEALRGLTLGLTRIIQAEILKGLFFDARPGRNVPSSIEDLLWDPSLPFASDGRNLRGLLRRRRTSTAVSIQSSAVIASPWNVQRLVISMQNLGPGLSWKAWRNSDNTHSVAWLPWPLIWVDNGNHTMTTAMLRHGGTLQCSETLDASPLLRAVRTDGENWIRVSDGQPFAEVRSVPMAALLTVGQRLLKGIKVASD